MSLDTYEVEWKEKAQHIITRKTRIYPGTPESAAQYIRDNEPKCEKVIAVRREIKIPRYKTCGYCRHEHVTYEIQYEDCPL